MVDILEPVIETLLPHQAILLRAHLRLLSSAEAQPLLTCSRQYGKSRVAELLEKSCYRVFRPQRGGLSESMDEQVTFESMAGLRFVLDKFCYGPGQVKVEPYGFDKRIGWDTHIVTVDGRAVGFTNGPVEP